MNRIISTSFLSAALSISLSILPGVAAADDHTVSAYAGCDVKLGNASGTGSGLRASGGSAVIACPILKKVANNNLNFVYARIKRALDGGADPFCNLNSHNSFNTATDSTWKSAPDGAGNKSLGLPLPTTYSNGYLQLICVLNVNDVLYGIRYGQD